MNHKTNELTVDKERLKMTVTELAEYICNQIDFDKPLNTEFAGCDFFLMSPEDLEKPAIEVKRPFANNYGIKMVDTGFCSEVSVSLVCDCYGGGCTHFAVIEEDDADIAVEVIAQIINATICVQEYVDKDEKLMVELF